jgi:hypothetical protein
MTLLELAERCEKATGPDRRLDFGILKATCTEREECLYVNGKPEPRYTASLDAAMTLVPEGRGLIYKRHGIKNVWRVQILSGDGNTFIDGDAATPALALCAAALRARGQ